MPEHDAYFGTDPDIIAHILVLNEASMERLRELDSVLDRHISGEEVLPTSELFEIAAWLYRGRERGKLVKEQMDRAKGEDEALGVTGEELATHQQMYDLVDNRMALGTVLIDKAKKILFDSAL